MSHFTIGVDFGTLSARAVVVDVATGRVVGTRACDYAHGVVDELDVVGIGTDFTACTVLPTPAGGTPHMLEGCPSLEVHPLPIGAREDPARLVFDAAPGPASVLGLADIGDRFPLVGTEIDTVEADEPLPHLPVARGV